MVGAYPAIRSYVRMQPRRRWAGVGRVAWVGPVRRGGFAVASAGSRGVLDDNHRLHRARVRWTVVMVTALVVGAVIYLLAVRTSLGQALEDAALRGSDQVDPDV